MLCRYGEVIYVDAQLRHYNHFGWPYIGITIKDRNNMIAVCCETIVTSEALDIYEWIIRTICGFVSNFSIYDIKIIFGDKFLRESLIGKLEISDTVNKKRVVFSA